MLKHLWNLLRTGAWHSWREEAVNPNPNRTLARRQCRLCHRRQECIVRKLLFGRPVREWFTVEEFTDWPKNLEEGDWGHG